MAALDTFPTQDAAGLSIGDTRLINAGQLVKDTTGAARLGIFPSNASALVTGTAATSPMTYSIAPFIGAASRTGVGAEIGGNDAAATVATTAAPGSNSRIDVIWWRPQFTGSSDPGNLPLFGVTQGTAALSPTKPAIPAGALELATAVILSTTVATNSGVVFAQTFPYTALAGGVVWLRNATEQTAWSPAAGSVAFRMDTGKFVDRIGSVWVTRGASVRVRTSTGHVTSGTAFTPLAIAWNLEDLDTDGFHDNSTNPSRFVAPADGIYAVYARIRTGSTVFGSGLQFGVNGTVDPATRSFATPMVGGGAGAFPQLSAIFSLTAGQYVEVFSLGEAPSLAVTVADCFASMHRIG